MWSKLFGTSVNRVRFLAVVAILFLFLQGVFTFSRGTSLRIASVTVVPVSEELAKGTMASMLALGLLSSGYIDDRQALIRLSLLLGALVGILLGGYEFIAREEYLLSALGRRAILHSTWSALGGLGLMFYWRYRERIRSLAVFSIPVLGHASWNFIAPTSLTKGWLLGVVPALTILIAIFLIEMNKG